MNFLRNTSVVCRRAVFAFVIISALAFAVFAQKSTQEGCKTYGCAGFVGEPINLKVVNADIRDILNYITEQYGINFVIDKSVGQIPVTVNVNEVPWNLALDSILQSQDLGVQVNGPILRIAPSTKLAQETEIQIQIDKGKLNAAPLYTEFVRLNYACAGQCASQTSFQGGNAGGGGGGSGTDQGILGIVKKRLSTRGAVEVDTRSNTLIITDVRENIDAIRQLVVLLDQPEPQVEIEARIVIASRNFSRDLGFQLSSVVVGSRGQGGILSTLPGEGNNSNPVPDRPVPSGSSLDFPQPGGSLGAGAVANTVLGLTTGIFGTARINALLTMGEQKGQAKIIATPRVTTLNNRKAEIESGSQIPVVTVQDAGDTGNRVFTTTFVSVPLRLEVTPQITDLGTVVLDVVTENNSVSATLSVGGVPGINTQRMKTKVTVPDGGTTVVGGALLDQESDDNFRTPGLSRIPLLGNLFKRKAVSRQTNEILFFITPRIYRPDGVGNQLPSKVSDGTRTTTILQPVPLGNPQSNSEPTTETPTQPVVVPVQPVIQPNTPTKQP